MSFPTQYIPSEPPETTISDSGPGPGPGMLPNRGLSPAPEDVQVMDPVPGEAVDMLRQTRRSVGFVGWVLVIIGLLVTAPAATFAVLKWDADNTLARKLALAAAGGFLWLLPALYLRAYARRIKRLIDFPTGDLLASALAAQRGFWRLACMLLTVALMIGTGLAGKYVSSKGIGVVSDDVRSRVMAFIGKPVNTPADANARVAATQPSATQPSATQPTATQPAAPEPAVATTPPADNPLRPPFQSGQASVETGETPATNK